MLLLGYAILLNLFHHPVETNNTLYFCSYASHVVWAELSLHVQIVMHNKSPVLVRVLTSSNTKTNNDYKMSKLCSLREENLLADKPVKKHHSFHFQFLPSIPSSTFKFIYQSSEYSQKTKSHLVFIFSDLILVQSSTGQCTHFLN